MVKRDNLLLGSAMMQYLGPYANEHVRVYIYDIFAPVVLMLI